MNQPFTPPDFVPTRRTYTDAWGRPIRGSAIVQDDEGRTGLVVGDDLRRLVRGILWGLAGSGVLLLATAATIAGLRAGGVL